MGRDAPPALVDLAATVALVVEDHAVRRPVCKRCGAAEFRQYGEVEIEIHEEIGRKVKSVELQADGSVSVKVDKLRLEHVRDLVDHAQIGLEDNVTFYGFECAACRLAEDKIEDLVIPEVLPGQRVILPGGVTADVAEISPFNLAAAGALRVLAAGEWWDFSDVEIWEPHPGQQVLGLAA